MKMNKLSNFVFAAVVGLGLVGAPALASASPVAPTPPAAVASAETQPGGAPAQTTSDASRYAEREKNAGAQENFRGGGASIYIGGSAVAVALIIVLAILIL